MLPLKKVSRKRKSTFLEDSIQDIELTSLDQKVEKIDTVQEVEKFDSELDFLINEDLSEYESALAIFINRENNEKIELIDMFYLSILNCDIFSLIHYLSYIRIPREVIFKNGMSH